MCSGVTQVMGTGYVHPAQHGHRSVSAHADTSVISEITFSCLPQILVLKEEGQRDRDLE